MKSVAKFEAAFIRLSALTSQTEKEQGLRRADADIETGITSQHQRAGAGLSLSKEITLQKY